jgi:hypothetical protein
MIGVKFFFLLLQQQQPVCGISFFKDRKKLPQINIFKSGRSTARFFIFKEHVITVSPAFGKR